VSDVVVIDEVVVLFGVEVGGAGWGRERRERMWVSFVERGVADAMVGRREGFFDPVVWGRAEGSPSREVRSSRSRMLRVSVGELKWGRKVGNEWLATGQDRSCIANNRKVMWVSWDDNRGYPHLATCTLCELHDELVIPEKRVIRTCITCGFIFGIRKKDAALLSRSRNTANDFSWIQLSLCKIWMAVLWPAGDNIGQIWIGQIQASDSPRHYRRELRAFLTHVAIHCVTFRHSPPGHNRIHGYWCRKRRSAWCRWLVVVITRVAAPR